MVKIWLRVAVLALLCSLPAGAKAGLTVSVDLSSQSMTVAEDGAVLHRWAVSSGRMGYRTPNGVYRPQRLARMHFSRRYGMAPMPHSIFFRGGYAIHGTGEVGRLGRTASHGCIRLAPGNAAELYGLVQAHGPGNTRIVITGSAAAADGGRSRPAVAGVRPRPARPRYAPLRRFEGWDDGFEEEPYRHPYAWPPRPYYVPRPYGY